MPTFTEKCAEMSRSPNSTYSPEYSFGAFQSFWAQRAEEIGHEPALKEYHATEHHFKQRVADTKDLHELGAFFAHIKFSHQPQA